MKKRQNTGKSIIMGINNKSIRIASIFIVFSLIFIALSVPVSAANPQIKVTTNRMVILDDPNSNYVSVTAAAQTGENFGLPGSWSSDMWNGESTTIRGVALVLNESGMPQSDVTVTFYVKDWDDAGAHTLKRDTNNKQSTTDANGLATVSFDLNDVQQYGYWTIVASATVNSLDVSGSSVFVYNWWGCQNCHGSPYSNGGDDKGYKLKATATSKYDPVSPYITGRDWHAKIYDNAHGTGGGDLNEGECWSCHNSYDQDLHLGQVRRSDGSSYIGRGVPSTYGEHSGKICADCHATIAATDPGTQTIKSCDASGCHVQATGQQNLKLTQIPVVSLTSGAKNSNYSALDVTLGIRTFSGVFPTTATFNSNALKGAKSHTSASSQEVPCTICHGPMHNVTKPSPSGTSNAYTEESQCLYCHEDKKHSTSPQVECTACHSQDAHKVRVLSSAATGNAADYPSTAAQYDRVDYVLRGASNALTYTSSDCVKCHNTSSSVSTFFNNISTLGGNPPYTQAYTPETDWMSKDIAYHNGSVGAATGVGCTVCHQSDNATQYHSIPFMQTDASFTNANATAVDCADCHLAGNTANTYVEGLGETPPEVNRKHNDNVDCQFCHDRSPHGKPKFISISASLADGTIAAGDYTETKANSIGMTNCTSCHVNATATLNTYFGTSETIPQQDRFGHAIAFHNGTAGGSTGVTCNVCHSDMHMAGYLNSSAQYQTSNVSAVGCADCHVNGNAANTYVNETFGLVIPEVARGHNGHIDCRLCHEESPHGKPHFINDSANLSDGVVDESDYTTIRSEAMVGCSKCHVNGNETLISFQGVTATIPKTDWYGYTITNHNNSEDFDCDICHNSMHDVGYLNNSAGFEAIFDANTTVTCSECHTDGTTVNNYADSNNVTPPIREFHNDAVDCSACHSKSPHGIRLRHNNGSFVDGYSLFTDEVNKVNCTSCHYANGPVNATTLGVERFPKFFADDLKHSINASSGKLWNESTYWNNPIEACGYCHGLEAMHATNALGNITHIYNGDNVIGANLDTTTTHWCAMCHISSYPGYNGTKFSPVPPTIMVNNTGNTTSWVYSSLEWFDHVDLAGAYEDRKCRSCHGDEILVLNSDAKVTDLMHFVGVGENGGDDCVLCHDLGGVATAQVNVTVFNASIHAGINQGGADSTGNPDNLACIGCHSSDGVQINTHPDKKSSPWVCDNCHVETGARNASTWLAGNATPQIIYNHYKGSDRNSTIIHAGEDETTDRLSCVACHNLSEMKNANDDDHNLAASEIAHYGKNRSDLRTAGVDDCAYCHQNTSTVFDVAMDINATYHKDMPEHTTLGGGPTCTNATCHGSGLIHDSTLQKPTLNTALCQECHSDKHPHNEIVSCDRCHTDHSTTDKDIHGIKFIQFDGSYSTSNSTGANCTTCHQNSVITSTSLNLTRLPKINGTLMHSNNASQGQVWNTTTGYWTDEDESCEYCHGQTKHTTALGRLTNFSGTNTINQSLSTGTWCQSCHYQNYASGSDTYDKMVATFTTLGLAIPPEITNNTSYGTYAINPAEYFDHQLDNYNDSSCMKCHYNGTAPNMTTLTHGVVIGGQSPDCTNCHTRDGRTPHIVNVTAVSMGVHVNLNNNTDVGPYPAITAACWGCHASNGTNQYGHPDKYNAAWACADCHVENGAANATLAGPYANATRTGSHFPGNVVEGVRTYPTDENNSCVSCHINSVVANTGVTYAVGYSSTSVKDANASHYSTKANLLTTTDATNCKHCHASGSSGYGAPVQITVGTHGFGFSTCQESCHNSAWETSGNVSLHNSSIGIYQNDAGCYNGKTGCHTQ
ncbi:MAG: hypothetical protein P1P69_05435 [Methanosarcinaceae archaeon]|nr:hypothetical protein [Methanosarcinaceae archaeon]